MDDSYKIILIGDSGVGKTSMTLRFIKSPISNVDPTIGAGTYPCKIKIDDTIRNIKIWDTAGQETYMGLIPQYCRGAHCGILVFDVTSKESFASLSTWIQFLESHSETFPIIIFGNKTDLEQSRVITNEDAILYSEPKGYVYCEGSAETGTGIDQLFYLATEKAIKFANLKVENSDKPTVRLEITEKKKKPICC